MAVKQLKLDHAEDAELVRNELHALGRLANHPNIVQIYHYSETKHYIVMEFLSGGSLQDALDDDSDQVKTNFVALATGICEGLQAAHRERYIHGDIKPENILLSDSAQPKLSDFGLARAIASSRPNVGLVGTPYYMAPEMVRGEEWDHRADIYSLGVLFYLMLAQRFPHDASTYHGLMLKIANESYLPLTEVVVDLPKPYYRIVSESLAPLDRRVRSIDEILHALHPPDRKPPETVNDYQDELREIYHPKNYFRSPLVLLWHLGTSLAGALGGLTSADPDYAHARAHAYLPRLFAWTCAVISALDWRVSDIVWFKYSNICPYCDHSPCECDTAGRLQRKRPDVNRELLEKLRARGHDEPASAPDAAFEYYESMFERIYGDVNQRQGIDVLSQRAQSEIFGVADALLRVKTLEDLRDVDVLHLELADLVAWFFAVLNAYKRIDPDYSFEENYLDLFTNGACYRCGARPCACDEIEDELRMFDWRRLDGSE